MNAANLPLDDRATASTRELGEPTITCDFGAGYGALSLVAHLLCTTRWDWLRDLAAGAVAASASLRLGSGIKDVFVWLGAHHNRATR